MRVLVVGAGAVGQVFGHHLAEGGAEVVWFVKPGHLAWVREGFTLYPLNRRRGAEPLRIEAPAHLTTPEEVERSAFDQVWLSVSATAMQGPWRAPLLRAAGDATVVCLTPGIETQRLLLEDVSDARLVTGMIGLLAYQAPLPGETRFAKPGIAYWFPPLSPSRFSGPREALDAVLGALKRGGLPARRVADAVRAEELPSAVLTSYMLALEAADWSFAKMRAGDHLDLAARAAREALTVAAHSLGHAPPASRALLRGWVGRMGLSIAPRLAPVDLEAYLAHHFGKVRDQTHLFARETLARAEAAGLPSTNLATLYARVAE
jgi:ketopantoate reductase